ncbi:hypothetical protein AB0F18_13090 [Streptomyces sp. NPDC029216]|uniref:hypothetical protein n=1 Tax=Streptomyces sp. NPDC029216 TaxID=3154701 RepID=UPI0033F39D92
MAGDGTVGPLTWEKLVSGTALAKHGTPAPAPATPSQVPGKLTHAQAMALRRPAGITTSSSGGCDDRDDSRCTSLDDIRGDSVRGVIALRKASGCPVVITGGSEYGIHDEDIPKAYCRRSDDSPRSGLLRARDRSAKSLIAVSLPTMRGPRWPPARRSARCRRT